MGGAREAKLEEAKRERQNWERHKEKGKLEEATRKTQTQRGKTMRERPTEADSQGSSKKQHAGSKVGETANPIGQNGMLPDRENA